MRKCATGIAAVGIGLFWMMACGGKAEIGGTGSAGAQNSAGSPSAGAPGSGSSGVSNAGAPATAGSPSTDVCSLPQVAGNCDGYEPSFWHNPQTGVCEPFVYGGCGGNGNRFATRDDCIAKCPGGGESWASCKSDGQCAVVPSGCCACEPIQEQQVVVINSMYDASQHDQSCGGGAACGPCPSATEYDATLKYLKPICSGNICTLIDVRKSELTECATDMDCVIREGVNCCTGCSGSGFVPASRNADFCDDKPTPCPACVSMGAEQYHARCNANGHCAFNPPLR